MASNMFRWVARFLSFLLVAFFAMFAADGWGYEPLIFLAHLIPAFIMLALALASWRWPRMVGITYIVLAIVYAVAVWTRYDWVAVISGPLILTGVLHILGSYGHSEPRPAH
jgi:hypothetical protein